MSETKITKTTKKAANTKAKESKVMKKEEVAVVETAVEAIVEKAEVKKEKKNKEKVAVTIPVLDNDTLLKLFHDNGCVARTHASNESNVVYNTFGTQSRVLQQKRAYQLLLTNGHKSTKSGIVDTENDDAKRFTEWYEQLSEDDKKMVSGYAEMMDTKLSASELPRERTVKLTSYDLLVRFIQYMRKFPENMLAKAE